MEKKKNERPNHLERNLLIAAMIFGVFVLMYFWMALTLPDWGRGAYFEQTKEAIEATNNHVATLIAQTEAAQAMVTGTAVP